MNEMNYENPLEKIISFGHIVEECDVLGQKIQLRVLNAGVRRDILGETAHLETMARVQDIKIRTLARSILSVNGVVLRYFPKTQDESVTGAKLTAQNIQMLMKAPQASIDAIYEKYVELVEKQEKIIEDVKKKSLRAGQEPSGKSDPRSASETS